MRCERARRLILDESLGLADRAAERALFAHCAACPACHAARLCAHELDLVLAKAASPAPGLPDLVPRIAQRVATHAPPAPLHATPYVAWAAALAGGGGIAALLVLAFGGPALAGLVAATPVVIDGLAVALRPAAALLDAALGLLGTLGAALLPSAVAFVRLLFWLLPALCGALAVMVAVTSFVLGRDRLRSAPTRRIQP
jgi:predicted anti-sigma-YlaC factor YlaD